MKIVFNSIGPVVDQQYKYADHLHNNPADPQYEPDDHLHKPADQQYKSADQQYKPADQQYKPADPQGPEGSAWLRGAQVPQAEVGQVSRPRAGSP